MFHRIANNMGFYNLYDDVLLFIVHGHSVRMHNFALDLSFTRNAHTLMDSNEYGSVVNVMLHGENIVFFSFCQILHGSDSLWSLLQLIVIYE